MRARANTEHPPSSADASPTRGPSLSLVASQRHSWLHTNSILVKDTSFAPPVYKCPGCFLIPMRVPRSHLAVPFSRLCDHHNGVGLNAHWYQTGFHRPDRCKFAMTRSLVIQTARPVFNSVFGGKECNGWLFHLRSSSRNKVICHPQ